jgi:hypothetical protein
MQGGELLDGYAVSMIVDPGIQSESTDARSVSRIPYPGESVEPTGTGFCGPASAGKTDDELQRTRATLVD